MMQRSMNPSKKLSRKIILEPPIWKESQRFITDNSWSLPLEHPLKSTMQKAAQLFDSLNHAMISWIACHDNMCSIHQSEKKTQLWYPSTLSRPSASLHLSVNKSEEKSSVNTIFTPKTAPSEIDPMEDTYRLSKLQIKEREVIVENRQYQL